MPGYTLIELMATTSILTIMLAAAVPLAHSTVDRSRTAGAATYVAARIASARMEAVKRSAFVAIQFVNKIDGYWFATYVDGNRNGVLARDISAGIDFPIGTEMRLDQQFPGVEFGIHPLTKSFNPLESLNYSDPIQIGRSALLSFNPNGSSTAGTLYIRGRHANQYAVRVLGVTARWRIFHFDFQDEKWRTP
jgi:prepilin-type N-terminal cleavage/methylation domain-containing protein